MAQLLRQCGELTDRFEIHHHSVNMLESDIEAWTKQAAEATIYLVQDVNNWQDYKFRDVASQKLCFFFPFLYFAALWPFDAHQNQDDDIAIQTQPTLPEPLQFRFHDSLLARLRVEVPDPEERFETYRTLNYRRPINIERFFQVESTRLRQMDTKYGFDIGAKILGTFRERRLFHTITHPVSELVLDLARNILRVANVDIVLNCEEFEDNADYFQVPIHPSIMESLGIIWINNTTRYKFYSRLMTFESYVRAYIFVYG